MKYVIRLRITWEASLCNLVEDYPVEAVPEEVEIHEDEGLDLEVSAESVDEFVRGAGDQALHLLKVPLVKPVLEEELDPTSQDQVHP